MAWITPRTWVAGEVVTAALLNAQLRDNENFLYTPPMCRLYHTLDQTLTSATALDPVLFDSERFDTDSMHSTITNTGRATVNTAGKFSAEFNGSFASNATGYRELIVIHKTVAGGNNSIAVDDRGAFAAVISGHAFSLAWPASVTDWFHAAAWQNSGGALMLRAAPAYSPELTVIWQGN